MNIFYQQKKNFPPLAWVADVKKGCVEVISGGAVEYREGFFVEGAWSGDFNLGDFAVSEWFCGTGGKITDNRIIFSSPTHVTYSLYSAQKEEGVVVSNSGNLLMAYMGYEYDPSYVEYEADYNTILDGINVYKKDIHVLTNKKERSAIQIYYFCNLIIDEADRLTVTRKQKVKDFDSFTEYEKRLKDAMEAMVKNAQHPSRTQKYDIATAVSKGYDAPACAAIFKDLGCNTAFTFAAIGKYMEDSGVEVAEQLGYKKIVEVEATEFKKRSDVVEAQIISSGDLGSTISSCVFDDLFVHRIVLSGERGDKIWDKNAKDVNNEFKFNDFVSGLGYGEHRLWYDFISCPMPLYGASAWKSIHSISNSDEMQLWSVGSSYDRPIPRRILEERGVSRETFGIKKHGAGFIYKFDWMKRIEQRMSAAAFADFKKYVEHNKRLRPAKTISYFWKMRSIYLSKLGIGRGKMSPREIGRITNPMAPSLLIPWAGNFMIQKYKKLIEDKT